MQGRAGGPAGQRHVVHLLSNQNTTLGFESVLPVGILGLLPEVLYFFSTAKSKNRTSNTTKFLL